MLGLVSKPLGSVDFNSVENLLPRLVTQKYMCGGRGGWREGEGGVRSLEEALTESDISFLNEGLNGTPPSKDWNYCHTELQIEFK